MFYGQCNDCGQRWELGTARTCTCKDEHMRDTIDMAREVKATAYTNRHYPDRTTYTFGPEQLKAFEALVRADERNRIEQAWNKLYGWWEYDNEENT